MLPVEIPADEIDPSAERVVFGVGQVEYVPLPAVRLGPAVWSRWHLSENERRAILDGADIDLMLLTFGTAMQPTILSVQGVDYTADGTDMH